MQRIVPTGEPTWLLRGFVRAWMLDELQPWDAFDNHDRRAGAPVERVARFGGLPFVARAAAILVTPPRPRGAHSGRACGAVP